MEYIQIISTILVLLSVYFTVKQNILCWPTGILGSAGIMIVFFDNSIYYQLILQTISIVQCVVGWYEWGTNDNIKINKFDTTKILLFIIPTVILGIIFNLLLSSNIYDIWGYFDAIATFIGILATFLMISKVIDSWWMFMINNVFLVMVCLHNDLYYFAFLYVVIFTISIKGYSEWNLILKNNEKRN